MVKERKRCAQCRWDLISTIPYRFQYAVQLRLKYLTGGDMIDGADEFLRNTWEYISPCYWYDDTALEER